MAMPSPTALVVRTPPTSPAPSFTPQYFPRTPRYPLTRDGRLSSNWVTFSLPSSSGTLRCCFHSSQLQTIHPLACERVLVGPTLMLLYPSRSLAFSSLSALLSFRAWQFPRGLLALTTTRQPFSSAASAASAGRSSETRFPGFAPRGVGQSPLAQSLPTVAEYGRSAVSDGPALTSRERRGPRRADDGGRLTSVVGLDSRAGLSEDKTLGVTTIANGVLNGVSRDDFHESINGATNEAPIDADTFRAASVDINRETRPMRFDEIIGQDNTVELLKAAVADNQVVSAYLFSGPHGTGKTSAARILASAIGCSARKPGDGNPCGGKCPHCRAVADGTSEVVVEIDAASDRGVAVARQIINDVEKAPDGTRIVRIIDECHMLTREALAALLKTLEEPVGNPLFILVTTDPGQLPSTNPSRCHKLAFSAVPNEVMVKDLRRIAQLKRWEASDDGLRAIAEEAAGSMRDAKKILQQLSLLKKRITGDLVLDHFKRLPQWKAEVMLVLALSDVQPTGVVEAAKDLERRGVAFPEVLRQLRDAATDALTRKGTNRQLDFIAASPEGRSLLQAVVKELREAEKQQKEEPTNMKLFISFLVELPLLLEKYPCSFHISAAADSASSSSPSPPSHPPSSLMAPAHAPSGAARAEGEWGELARKAMAEMTPHQRSLFTQQACIVAVTDTSATDTTVTLSFLQAWIKKLNDGRRKTIIPGFTEAFSKALRSRVTIQLVDKESLGAATDAPSAEDLAAAASASAAAAAKSDTVPKGAGRKVPEERRRVREGVSQWVPEEEGSGLVVTSPQPAKGKEVWKNSQAREAKAGRGHLSQPSPAQLEAAAAKSAAKVAAARRAGQARAAAKMRETHRREGQQALQGPSPALPTVVIPGAADAYGSFNRSEVLKIEAGSGSGESESEHGRGAADGWDSNEVSMHGPSRVNAVPSTLPANAGFSTAFSASSSSGGNDITAEAVGHGTELPSPELVDFGITEAGQPRTPAPDEVTGTVILGGGEADHGMTVGSLSHDYQASITDAQPGPSSVPKVKAETEGAFLGSHECDAVVEGPAGGALVNGVENGDVVEDTVHDGRMEASVGHGIIDGGLLGDAAQGENLITDVERASDAVPVVAPYALVDGAAAAWVDGDAAASTDNAAVALADGAAATLADGAAESRADVEPVGAADVEAVGAAESDVEAVGAAESDVEAVGAAAAYVEDAAVVPASTVGADMEAAETGANAGGSSISAHVNPRVAAAEVDTGMDAAYPVDGRVGFRGYPDSGRREEGGALAASRMSPSRGTRPTVATASAGRGTSGSNVGGSTGGAVRMAFAPRGRTRGPFKPKALPSDHGALSRTDPGAEPGRPVNDVKTGGRFDDLDPAEAAAIALCKAFGGRLFVLREDNDREVDK